MEVFGRLDLVRRLQEAGVPPSSYGAVVAEIRLFIQGSPPSTEAAGQLLEAVAGSYTQGFGTIMLVTAASWPWWDCWW